MFAIPRPPLPYEPRYEFEEDGEQETCAQLLQTLHGISATTYADSGHATRSVHAKSHGLLRARLQVLDGLAPELAQGLFATPASYDVVMRISTIPGDMLDDKVSVPRGMAIKVTGVPGTQLSSLEPDDGTEPGSTQDFVLVNGPAFLAPSAKKFLGSLKLLASTTDKVPRLKQALSTVLQGAEKALEAVGGESGTLKSLGGHPETHVLGETYYSQAPILYGVYMAKVALVPVLPELSALKGAPVDLDGKPNGLRDAVVAYFARHAATWEVRIQLCRDIASMPLEDASVAWPEADSPYLPVARITAQPQAGWSEALSRAVDDGMAFSPWHGLLAHRPLGSIMRVRKAAYAMSARFRFERTGKVAREPRNLDDVFINAAIK
ncbi:catalase family protein [Janthinobacterium sp. EB271-G4-7A]|uniref:catalase family protein n=1 Tax=Janthinobacterium sp. EB271-G4-7A TaxID=2775056 RepID=UPI001E4E156A|nr:catalase family protein [Janthinobacterium sp. EB271-G4-7A]MCC7697465.1 catalase family protein [Janthinobacterium sp. EB271-G4-7A]